MTFRLSAGNMMGKYTYTQFTIVLNYYVNLANRSGATEGTVSGAFVFNSTDGTRDGVIDSGLGDITQRFLIFNNTSGLILSYNNSTGAVSISCFNGYDTRPAVSDTWVLGPALGSSISHSNGSSGEVLCLTGSGSSVRIELLNDQNYSLTSGTVTLSDGTTFTSATCNAQRHEHNIYGSTIVNDDAYIHRYHSTLTGTVLNLASTGHNVPRISPVSPYNVASNDRMFIWEHHLNQWICIEQRLNVDVSPWINALWVTTEWGAANLADGVARLRDTGQSEGSSNPMEFNNVHYVQWPAWNWPAINRGLTLRDEVEGVLCEYGSYFANLDTYTGETIDWGRVDVSTTKMGHCF